MNYFHHLDEPSDAHIDTFKELDSIEEVERYSRVNQDRLKKTREQRVRIFVKNCGLENDLISQMMVQRLMRYWEELEVIDLVLDKIGLTYGYEKDGILIMKVRGLVYSREMLDKLFRQTLNDIGLQPRDFRRFMLEKTKIENQGKRLEHNISKEVKKSNKNVIDFASAITKSAEEPKNIKESEESK
jgi:hypothetical protein